MEMVVQVLKHILRKISAAGPVALVSASLLLSACQPSHLPCLPASHLVRSQKSPSRIKRRYRRTIRLFPLRSNPPAVLAGRAGRLHRPNRRHPAAACGALQHQRCGDLASQFIHPAFSHNDAAGHADENPDLLPALWGSPYQIIPDSLFTNSPAQVGFDTAQFVASQPGWLKDVVEYAADANRSAAEVIDYVALKFSVSPRLLLALLEYQAGALSQPTATEQVKEFPLVINPGTTRDYISSSSGRLTAQPGLLQLPERAHAIHRAPGRPAGTA